MSWLSDLRQFWSCFFAPASWLQHRYRLFKELLDHDRASHRALSTLERYYHNGKKVDFHTVRTAYGELSQAILALVESLNRLAPGSYGELLQVFRDVDSTVQSIAAVRPVRTAPPHVLPLDAITAGSAGLAGTKATNLARLGQDLGLPVPRGFVITTNAFQYFLQSNRLGGEIAARLTQLDIESTASLTSVCSDLTQLLETAPLPPDLGCAITDASVRLTEQCGGMAGVCVRSSAEQEDGTLSFAGQYRTLLNVKPAHLDRAYKKVIASKYSLSALAYRVANGLLDEDTRMAVLVLEMVDVTASGVLYTRNPLAFDADRITIYSVWGLGEMLVSGAVSPDVIEVSRAKGLPVVKRHPACKSRMGVPAAEGGFEAVTTPPADRNRLSLDDPCARQLAEWGLRLEAYFGAPQDIEWCQDRQGNLFIVQSRSLGIKIPAESPGEGEIPLADISHRTLLAQGEQAAPGIAAGRVVRLMSVPELTELPQDTVLVAPSPSPEFTKAIGSIRAVVTDEGSVAGHFASVAREQGIPTLTNTRVASQVLKSGQIVTVDADRQMVFAGTVEELLNSSCRSPDAAAPSPFRRRLRDMLDWISPLHLTDPRAPGFTASACKSLHDILRFAHEKAVQEMLALGQRKIPYLRSASRLKSDIPIVLYVMDLGGGIVSPHTRSRKTIKPEDVANPPLRALWRGLESPNLVWPRRLRHLDWQEFDRVSAGVMRLDSQLLASFALISKDYLNINIRFGYHFVVLDSLCDEELQQNYIAMRFEGGGAAFGGRYLRVLFISRVLQQHAFEVHLEGDRLEAQLRHVSSAILQENMVLLGHLLGFTRLLDVRLTNEAQVDKLAAEFIAAAS